MRVAIRTFVAVVLFVAACAFVLDVRFPAGAQENRNAAARFVFDGSWPKLPLPNKWTFGGVTGLAVDNDDMIWVLHRPNDLNETENFAALDPPQAECCIKAPAVLAFDRQGNLVHSWDTPQGHMLMVDSKDQVWVGSDTFRIYTKPGKLIAEFPRSPQRPAPARQGGPPVTVDSGGDGDAGDGRRRRVVRRARARGVRDRQLSRRTRPRIRHGHLQVQARLGRIREAAQRDWRRCRGRSTTRKCR